MGQNLACFCLKFQMVAPGLEALTQLLALTFFFGGGRRWFWGSKLRLSGLCSKCVYLLTDLLRLLSFLLLL